LVTLRHHRACPNAVGYISRPAGAILFGHLGDTRGRGTCLLISVLVMGIPTVLIGCLPSYHHIGIAAPILLAILRLIQSLAMGGEFGAVSMQHGGIVCVSLLMLV
jgi:MFS family permease